MMRLPRSILQWIHTRKKPQETILVGIDGPGGAGKTSLTDALKKLDTSLTVVHMDHFDLPSNGKESGDPWKKDIGEDTDWQRLLREVLIPLQKGESGFYRPYNRDAGRWEAEQTVSSGGIVVVEGVFAIRKELFPFYTFTLWVTCPLQVRLARALRRDGEHTRSRWEHDWLPMEERYMKEHKPHLYADTIIHTDL